MSATRLATDCPFCGRPMALRTRRNDGSPFLGCTGYSARREPCTFVEAFNLNIGRVERELRTAIADRDYLRDLCAEVKSRLLVLRDPVDHEAVIDIAGWL